jgi:hypothetical protein
MTNKFKFRMVMVLAVLMLFAATAQADLARVGPVNTPSPPGHGFPFWYQDLGGMVLDFCLPDANDPGALQETACLLVRPPTPPYVFPTNFPSEIFYFRAVSAPLDTGSGKRATLVLALEGAFGAGTPAAGQQMAFTRIRVTAGVNVAGTYTVTHPYGTETFTDVVPGVGNRDITFTQDVGLAPGNFTDALASRVGPFLQPSNTPGGPPLAPITLNGAQFLSDGATLVSLTGSPFGTDYFEICGPANAFGPGVSCVRQNSFTLTGRLHNFATNPIGSPLTVDRATYARSNTTAQVDVVATVSAGIGQLPPVLTAAAPELPPVLMDQPTPNPLGHFYAQGIPVPAGTLPGTITVTNTADVPPTSVTKRVVDEVTILDAIYTPSHTGGGTLVVTAISSDRGATGPPAVPAPILSLDAFPTAIGVAGIVPGSVVFTVSGSGVPVLPLPVPPLFVTVTSSAGGQGRADVTIATPAAAAFAAGHPFAQNDVATVVAGSPAISIPVLANDSVNGAALAPATLAILLAPTSGTALANANGTVTYTPPTVAATATFTYTVRDTLGNISNVGTVTVNVTAPANPIPTANPDTFTVAAGSTTVLNVLANDAGNGGVLDPASVLISTPPAAGTATRNANGTITFVAGAAGSNGNFSYTVANTLATGGVRSAPALVTINVVPVGDTLTITSARFRTGTRRWDVAGTATVNAPNVVTVKLVHNGVVGATIGTASPVAGAWLVTVASGSPVIAVNGDQVIATSTAGGTSAAFTVRVTQ